MSKQKFAVGQNVTVRGAGPAVVVSVARGWVTVTLSTGAVLKVRSSAINVKGGGLKRCKKAIFRRYALYARTRTANGCSSADNNDVLAQQLRGKELPALYQFAAKQLDETVGALRARYGKRNAGMQRMNLGNRLRALTKSESE